MLHLHSVHACHNDTTHLAFKGPETLCRCPIERSKSNKFTFKDFKGTTNQKSYGFLPLARGHARSVAVAIYNIKTHIFLLLQ